MQPMSPRFKQARVLVVDDAEFSVQLLLAAVGKAGFENVGVARDGLEALEMTRSWQPDIVITDLKMPNLDGIGYCERVRSDPEAPRMPIIVQTMMGEREIKLAALSKGADDFLNKPFDQEELTLRMRLHLERYFMMQDMNDTCTYMRMELEQAEILMRHMQQSLPSPALNLWERHREVLATVAALTQK